ncbi:hypothetical protein [Aliiruegeria lutimaris]|uniref:Uncharacterized protein n=1 Tax=Aliiruegeria lutimaris TaxID=571298 RepID=A0A1G8VUZ9_9RHOB|nr:hypothetical protein [Aliiruegeria lutimaris]SDJ69951.1 hypothetical protein SAMN04488026_102250 [Aliiruegeria lutimaris]
MATLFGAALLLSVSLAQAATFGREDSPLTGWTHLPVLDESLVISAPRGYCIDPLASLSGHRAAFVLMASCRSVTGDLRAARPEIQGLLTTSVDGHVGPFPSQGDLSRFFGSATGRAALSRSGNAEAMELGAMFSRSGVLFLRADERGEDPALGGASWRAVFELKGHMVTATLRDLVGQPIKDSEGFRIVEELVDAILSANPNSTESEPGAFSRH